MKYGAGTQWLYRGSPIVVLHSDDNRPEVFVKDLKTGAKFNVHYGALKPKAQRTPPTRPIAFRPSYDACPQCGASGFVGGVECGCGYLEESFKVWLKRHQ